jgi:hypothetical protein
MNINPNDYYKLLALKHELTMTKQVLVIVGLDKPMERALKAAHDASNATDDIITNAFYDR